MIDAISLIQKCQSYKIMQHKSQNDILKMIQLKLEIEKFSSTHLLQDYIIKKNIKTHVLCIKLFSFIVFFNICQILKM